MSIWKEFREFAFKGNVVDLAVGVIIGGAFGGIVKSFVDDVVMPPLGMLTGGTDFANKFYLLKEGAKAPGPYATVADAKAAGASVLAWGTFANTVLNFFLVATAIFILIRTVNKFRTLEAPPKTDVDLLTEIRDILQKQAKAPADDKKQ